MASCWPASTIGEIVDRGGGEVRTGPFGSQLHRSDYVQDAVAVPVVMPKDMSGGYVDYSSIARISAEKASSLADHLTRPGDVLLARRGDIGRCAFIRQRDRGILCGTGCIRLSTQGTDLDPAFLHRFLMLPQTAAQLEGMAVGSTMANLNGGIVRSLEVPLPPLHTQARIASILSAYDDLIENNTRRIQILEELAQAIYREWFVEFRFPGHEGVQMVESELGPIPDGWRMTAVQTEITLEYGKALKESNRLEGHVPVVGSSSVVGYHNEALVSGPGIVVGRKGNAGSVLWIDQDFFPIDTTFFVETTHELPFVYYQLRQIPWVTSDTAVPGLSRRQAYLEPFLNPPAELETTFADTVSPMRELIHVLQESNGVLRQTRDLLLPRLISGEIDVSNLDMENAEPAA